MEEERQPASKPEYKSQMTPGETLAALVYLPVHILLLPGLLYLAMSAGYLNEAQVNLLCYGVGLVYMLTFLRHFLRRDFDPLCDRPGYCFLQILACYGLMLAFNLGVSGILALALGSFNSLDNPNNAAFMDMTGLSSGGLKAMAVFMAPVIEELMFRGGIFGSLRERSRFWAYALSMLAFSLYHIWAYAMIDPLYWIYIIQYLPVSYLLCRCYERTESIWCGIFFHMLVNSVSIRALTMLEELL